jgi:hypothetical protein
MCAVFETNRMHSTYSLYLLKIPDLLRRFIRSRVDHIVSICNEIYECNDVYLESRGAASDESGSDFGDPMWERELEIGRQELLDVRSANVCRLFDLHNTEDL